MKRLHDMGAQKINKMDNIRKGNNETSENNIMPCAEDGQRQTSVNQNAFGM